METIEMEPVDWTETQVLRATRNSLIWNGISLAVMLFIVWLVSGYFYWFFRGPDAVSDPQLLQMIQQNRERLIIGYVSLDNRTLQPTEWQEVTTADGKPYASVPYFLLPVGNDHSILVLANSAADGKHLVGPVGDAREIDLRVIAKITQKHPELQNRILPIVLNHVAAFNAAGYFFLVILIPWGVYCTRNIANAVLSRISPSHHAIERQLAKWGDPVSLVASINQEIGQETSEQFGKALLTDSWILRPTVFGATCIPLQEVVWAYALHRSSENFVVLHLRNRKTSAIFLSRNQTTDLISSLASRAPWLILGFDAERSKTWVKNPEKIIAQSDQRRSKT